VFVQKRVIGSALGSSITSAPWFLKLFRWFPFLQRIPGYMVGIGVRPEHICDRIKDPKIPLLKNRGRKRMKTITSLLTLLLLCSVSACAQDMHSGNHHSKRAGGGRRRDTGVGQAEAGEVAAPSGMGQAQERNS
jgi:hypothetical protein